MITSTGNNQIKKVEALLKKSSERRKYGLFVVEGIRMFREIPSGLIEMVYSSESFARNNPSLLSGYDYETVSDNVYRQMSDTRTPQGIMAVVRMPSYSEEDILHGKEVPLIVVLENIQDPGNLGTIVRTAEGVGASGIIMSGDTVDIYNPKVIRSTMGSLFRIPYVYTGNIMECVNRIKKNGIEVFAAHLNGNREYYCENMRQPAALLIGNEGNGLTAGLAACADCMVRIPMEGRLESLNAAVSASVILYEIYRQRHVG